MTLSLTQSRHKQLQFQLILENRSFPTSVHHTHDNLVIKVSEFPISFPLIKGYINTDEYEEFFHYYNIKYQVKDQTLSFHFKRRQAAIFAHNILSDLIQTLQNSINIISNFQQKVSGRILQTVERLRSRYNVEVENLNLLTASLLVTFRENAQFRLQIKSSIGPGVNLSLTCDKKLLTTQLYEIKDSFNIYQNIDEVFDKICISVDFQLALDQALFMLARYIGKNYEIGSYSLSDFTFIPKDFDEIVIIYRKSYMLGVRFLEEHKMEVCDLSAFNPSLKSIPLLPQILHHCVSRVIKQQRNISPEDNSVNPTLKEQFAYHLLDLIEPKHIKSTFTIIFNYIIIQYEIQACLNVVKSILSGAKDYIEFKAPSFYTIKLSQPRQLQCPYDIRLEVAKTNDEHFPFSLNYNIIEQNNGEAVRTLRQRYTRFFNEKVTKVFKLIQGYLPGFIKISLCPTDIQSFLSDVLLLELQHQNRIEILLQRLEISANEAKIDIRIWEDTKFVDIHSKMVSEPSSPRILVNIQPDYVMEIRGSTQLLRLSDWLNVLLSRPLEELNRHILRNV